MAHMYLYLLVPCLFLRVSPQTELDENVENEKETKKQEAEQGSKEKVKSNVQGMAPGLG